MARSDWILPRADSACGKVFHPDRRSAEGHRIALEFWNQATGHAHRNYYLATYRCKRCGGFHIGKKRISAKPATTEPCQAPSQAMLAWTSPDHSSKESEAQRVTDTARLADLLEDSSNLADDF